MANTSDIIKIGFDVESGMKEALAEIEKGNANIQKKVNENRIEYKISGDDSQLKSIISEISKLKPQGLTVDFDDSAFKKRLNDIESLTTNKAKSIGDNFANSISNEIKSSDINSTLQNILGDGVKINKAQITKKIGELRTEIKNGLGENNINLSSIVSDSSQLEKYISMYKELATLSEYIEQNMGGRKLAKVADLNSLENISKEITTLFSSADFSTVSEKINEEFSNSFEKVREFLYQMSNIGNGSFGDLTNITNILNSQIDSLDNNIKELERDTSSLSDKANSIRQLANGINWENINEQDKSYKELISTIKEYIRLGGTIKDAGTFSVNGFKDKSLSYLWESLGQETQLKENTKIQSQISKLVEERGKLSNILSNVSSIGNPLDSSVADTSRIIDNQSEAFHNMSTAGTQSIEAIIQKLDELKSTIREISDMKLLPEVSNEELLALKDSFSKINDYLIEVSNITLLPELDKNFNDILKQKIDNLWSYEIKIKPVITDNSELNESQIAVKKKIPKSEETTPVVSSPTIPDYSTDIEKLSKFEVAVESVKQAFYDMSTAISETKIANEIAVQKEISDINVLFKTLDTGIEKYKVFKENAEKIVEGSGSLPSANDSGKKVADEVDEIDVAIRKNSKSFKEIISNLDIEENKIRNIKKLIESTNKKGEIVYKVSYDDGSTSKYSSKGKLLNSDIVKYENNVSDIIDENINYNKKYYDELERREKEYTSLVEKYRKEGQNQLKKIIDENTAYAEKYYQLIRESEIKAQNNTGSSVNNGESVQSRINKITDNFKTNEKRANSNTRNHSVDTEEYTKAAQAVASLNDKLSQNASISKAEIDNASELVSKFSQLAQAEQTLCTKMQSLSDAEKLVNQHLKSMTGTSGEILKEGIFKTGNNGISTLSTTIRDVNGEVKNLKFTYNGSVLSMENTTKSFQTQLSGIPKVFDTLKNKSKELLVYWTANALNPYDLINVGRKGFDVVKELDDAYTEMRKVSDESVSSLKAYQKETFNTANDVGTTAKQIQNSTADWQRLGYAISEASALAETSNIYKNVSDADIDTATEHMVSSVQAWKSEFNDNVVETAKEVADKYNKIGNEYAISSADIGEAMEESAASLKAAGNSLNESLGILTAGNLIQQDASTTASAIKILGLRIRGAKADLDELGESTDDLADSTSKMREELKALTGVDIMLDENTFKSTAQIIKEIGANWDKMTDVSRAAALEKLAGKNRASTVAGLIENYQTIDDVIKSAENASGSALEENEKYLDSIDGKLEQLTNKAQQLASVTFDTDFLKNVISSLTTILDLVTKLVDSFGAGSLISGGAGIAINKMLG